MAEVEWGWVRDQLEALDASEEVTDMVRALLEDWEEMELSKAEEKQVLEFFSAFAQGHTLITGSSKEEVWVPGEAGEFVKAETVRVKANAFHDQLGRIHNGRVGKVVDIRYGDIIVNSTDGKTPNLEGVHYSPYQLERKIQ